MEHRDAEYPKSRRNGILVDHVRDETILYDEERQEAHSLNRTAGLVWTHSDGTRSVSDLAALLGTELGIEVSDSLVEYTLEELSRVHLLENQDGSAVSLGRREVLRRLATTGAAAVALPVVLSVLAPTPAMAASGSTQNSQGQNNNNQGQNQQ